MNHQTFLAKNNEVEQKWVLIDATDQVLGRLSDTIAEILMGKNKPTYTPHHDVGDFVVLINVDKIRITGRKADAKVFQSYSGYPGGQKRTTYAEMLKNRPELLLERSVRRMMPGNKITKHRMTKLKMYRGSEHPHAAQNPTPFVP